MRGAVRLAGPARMPAAMPPQGGPGATSGDRS